LPKGKNEKIFELSQDKMRGRLQSE